MKLSKIPLLVGVLLLALVGKAWCANYSFGPGVYEVDSIVLDSVHSSLTGAGRGITILKVKNGIMANYPEPILRDFSVVGQGTGTGITLRNVWTARVIDVEIENYDTGMVIEVTEEGRVLAGGYTLQSWPSCLATTPAGHWGSRTTLTEIRGLEVDKKCNAGVILRNLLPLGNKGNGEFFTATLFSGGHIAAKQNGMVISENVLDTRLEGLYFDGGLDSCLLIDSPSWLGIWINMTSFDNGYQSQGAVAIKAKHFNTQRYVKFGVSNVDASAIIYMPDEGTR